MGKEKRPLPRPFKMPWGKGMIVEEAGCFTQWHEPVIQLMEFEDGGYAVRFAHYYKGGFQRAPLMVDPKALRRLRGELKKMPRLRKFLKSMVG